MYEESSIGQSILARGESSSASVVPGESGIPSCACQESMQWPESSCAARDESMIEVDKPQILAQFAVRGWPWEVLNDLDFAFQGTEAFTGYMMSQKIQLSDSKHTLRNVDKEAMVVEALKHEPEMMQVLFGCCAGNLKVVDVPKTELQPTQDLVHEPLKGLGGVA